MPVVSGPTIRPGFPKADFSLSQRKYTVQWLVTVNSYADGPIVAQSASGLPAAYSTYAIGDEVDLEARLREWNAYRLEDNSLTWVVEAKYSTPERKELDRTGTGAGTNRDNPSAFTDPTQELPTVKTWLVEREVPITRIYNINTGAFNPPMNSACQIYNPPLMRKDRYLALSITRNEALSTVHPALGIVYANAVNSDVFFGMTPGTWQCQGITAERQQKNQQGGGVVYYLKCEYTFFGRPEGWDIVVLDAGDYYCSPSGSGSGGSGSGSGSGGGSSCGGTIKAGGSSGSGSGVFSCPSCCLDQKKPFLDAGGHPRKGLLDGHGGQGDPSSPVWVTLRPYNWLAYSSLGLPNAFTDPVQ